MVMTPGRERSIAQYRELLAAAGLRLAKVTPTRSPAVIMEAVFDGSQEIRLTGDLFSKGEGGSLNIDSAAPRTPRNAAVRGAL
jgi:hypothetical protein